MGPTWTLKNTLLNFQVYFSENLSLKNHFGWWLSKQTIESRGFPLSDNDVFLYCLKKKFHVFIICLYGLCGSHWFCCKTYETIKCGVCSNGYCYLHLWYIWTSPLKYQRKSMFNIDYYHDAFAICLFNTFCVVNLTGVNGVKKKLLKVFVNLLTVLSLPNEGSGSSSLIFGNIGCRLCFTYILIRVPSACFLLDKISRFFEFWVYKNKSLPTSF